jgi:L-alanine-DL-glutamate epimerase-like enolase superfamily enzyme
MSMGFKAVKMRAGRNIRQDSERVKVVREVIGPDTRLMIDFNTSQTYKGGVSQAIKFCKSLEQFDVFWFEDPVVMDDLAGLKQISDAVDSAIATGEYEQTIWGFRDLIVNKAADIILPDATQVCGGITEWRRIAALADAYRIPIAAHIGDLTHVHCVAAVPNGLIVEYFRPQDTTRRMYEAEPLALNKDGMFEVPQSPGFGMSLNEDFIRMNLVS